MRAWRDTCNAQRTLRAAAPPEAGPTARAYLAAVAPRCEGTGAAAARGCPSSTTAARLEGGPQGTRCGRGAGHVA